MPKMLDLILGIFSLIYGAYLLWHLPRYQRRVENGEVQRDKSQPSFKALRRAAVGFVFLGLIIIVGWNLDLF